MRRSLATSLLLGFGLVFAASAQARSMRAPRPDLQPAALAYAPDGSSLLSVEAYGQRALVDAATGTWDYLGEKLPMEVRVDLIAIAPETGMAVGMRQDQHLVRWTSAAVPPLTETEGPRVLHTFQEKARAIATDARGGTIAAIDGNGEVVVIRGRTRVVSVWSEGPGAPFASRRAPAGQWPGAIAVEPSGGLVAVGFETGAVRLTGSTHPAPTGGGAGVTAVAFDSDGSHVVAARGAQVTLYEVRQHRAGGPSLGEVRTWEAPGPVKQLAVTADGARVLHLLGDTLFAGRSEEPIWVAEPGAEGATSGRSLGEAVGSIRVLAVSPDGARLVTNRTYFDLATYDLATGAVLTEIPGAHAAGAAVPRRDAPGWLGQ